MALIGFILLFAGIAGFLCLGLPLAAAAAARARGRVQVRLVRRLDDLFIAVDPQKALAGLLAGALALLLAGVALTGSALSLLVTVPLSLVLPRLLFSRLRKKRLDRVRDELPQTMTLISNGLKAGLNIIQAVERAIAEGRGSLVPELRLMLEQSRLGVTLERALEDLARRLPLDEVQQWVAATAVAQKTGGNLSQIYDRLAETMRDHRAIEGKVRSLTAQGKLQGLVVGLMPVAVALGLLVVSPESLLPFFSSTAGRLLVAAGAAMELVGAYFIRRIITIDV